jgi:hypothetical protein
MIDAIIVAFWAQFFIRMAIPAERKHRFNAKAKALWRIMRAKRYAVFTDEGENATECRILTEKFRAGAAMIASEWLSREATEVIDGFDADRALEQIKKQLNIKP